MRKNIYIKPADSAVFVKAEELFGENFSAMVADAVRDKVAAAEARAAGFEDVVLRVGNFAEGTDTKIRFRGKMMGRCLYRQQPWELYLTGKGEFLVWHDQGDQAGYDTYSTICDMMAAKVPDELFK